MNDKSQKKPELGPISPPYTANTVVGAGEAVSAEEPRLEASVEFTGSGYGHVYNRGLSQFEAFAKHRDQYPPIAPRSTQERKTR